MESASGKGTGIAFKQRSDGFLNKNSCNSARCTLTLPDRFLLNLCRQFVLEHTRLQKIPNHNAQFNGRQHLRSAGQANLLSN